VNARIVLEELEDLVSGAEIARRLGVSTQRVHQMRDEDDDFPEPLGRVGNSIVWRWREVEKWAHARTTRNRQPQLSCRSAGYIFETVPAEPGAVLVSKPNGEHDGEAVAWIGAPILELRPHRSGVTVVSSRYEGEITKNAKGYWTLSSARERLTPPPGRQSASRQSG
jgi:predicted DNA-binding transcriptional regulator AlpA